MNIGNPKGAIPTPVRPKIRTIYPKEIVPHGTLVFFESQKRNPFAQVIPMSEPSQPFYIPLNHRRFLKSIALASAGFTIPAQAAELTAAGLAPTPSVESGLIATLSLGLYTALLAGDNNGTGVGLVEVYDLR